MDSATARRKMEHSGQTFYFCSDRCRTKFAEDPQKYISGKAQRPSPAAVPEGTIYTECSCSAEDYDTATALERYLRELDILA